MQEDDAVLRLEDVIFENGGFRLDANMRIDAGRKLAVIGPSGAGKSTFVNGIAGFHDIVHGSLFWRDVDLTDLPPGKRPIAMLFQDGNLFPHLTIRQNVGLGVRPDLKLTSPDWASVEQALDRVGLSDLTNRRPSELSGGQQSRAALARVLVQAQPVLLLDEPFAALGPALKDEMLDLVSELANESGATVLMVSHDPGDAARIADQIILVDAGHASAPVDATTILSDPPPALQAYLGTR